MRIRHNNAASGPQTETAAFKKWFGKSKVVDADGKPLVVYHGTSRGGFSVFKLVYDDRPSAVFFSNKRTVAGDYAGYGQKVDLPGPVPRNLPTFKTVTDLRRFVKSPENDFDGWKMHFLESHQVVEEGDEATYTGMGARVATRYVLWWQKGDRDVDIAEGYYPTDVLLFEANAAVKRRVDIAGVYAVYLRMLKPMVVDGKSAPWMSIPYKGGYYKTDQLADIARSKGHDGLILRNIYDNPIQQIEISDVYVVFDPHNIKSATANVGTFDINDPDIRHNPVYQDTYVKHLPDKTQRFVEAYRERDLDAVFAAMGVKVDLSVGMGAGDLASGISLDEIRVTKKRAGVGTRAMNMLTDLADEFGLPMFLYANPLEGNISTYDLAAFYRGFGFEQSEEDGSDEDEDEDTGVVMVRYPEPRTNPRRRR
jgi:hypothetical protein